MNRERIAYTDFGKHKVYLERERDVHYVIHMSGSHELQCLEYSAENDGEIEESWRDYNLICETIKALIDTYGIELTIFKGIKKIDRNEI